MFAQTNEIMSSFTFTHFVPKLKENRQNLKH